MKNQVYYRCHVCGNLAEMVESSGMTPQCCGQPMEKMEAGRTDASTEKHVPVITSDGKHVTVTVGELPHPMSELHYIDWICLQTTRGSYRKQLYPGEPAIAHFKICRDERIVCAFAYCNLHGLWQACPTQA